MEGITLSVTLSSVQMKVYLSIAIAILCKSHQAIKSKTPKKANVFYVSEIMSLHVRFYCLWKDTILSIVNAIFPLTSTQGEIWKFSKYIMTNTLNELQEMMVEL